MRCGVVQLRDRSASNEPCGVHSPVLRPQRGTHSMNEKSPEMDRARVLYQTRPDCRMQRSRLAQQFKIDARHYAQPLPIRADAPVNEQRFAQ